MTGTTILVDNPDAGGLAADAEEVCLDGGTAMLSATPDGAAMPCGARTLYVLTSGSGLVMGREHRCELHGERYGQLHDPYVGVRPQHPGPWRVTPGVTTASM